MTKSFENRGWIFWNHAKWIWEMMFADWNHHNETTNKQISLLSADNSKAPNRQPWPESAQMTHLTDESKLANQTFMMANLGIQKMFEMSFLVTSSCAKCDSCDAAIELQWGSISSCRSSWRASWVRIPYFRLKFKRQFGRSFNSSWSVTK